MGLLNFSSELVSALTQLRLATPSLEVPLQPSKTAAALQRLCAAQQSTQQRTATRHAEFRDELSRVCTAMQQTDQDMAGRLG